MRKCFQCLAALQLMTGVANVGLTCRLQNGILRRVADMTVGARYFVIVMWAAMPAEANIAVVTVEAHAVLYRNVGAGPGTKFNDGRPCLAAPYPGSVCATWPVTGFALQLAVTERTA